MTLSDDFFHPKTPQEFSIYYAERISGNVGMDLLIRMKKAGVTRKQVVEITGLDPRTVDKVLYGHSGVSLRNYGKVAYALNASIAVKDR